MKKRRFKHSSTLLQELATRKTQRDYIMLQTILRYLGKRSFGIILAFFALPNLIPLSFIPGYSLIFSIPLAFIAIQMIIASHSIWLPKFLGNIKIPQDKLSDGIKKVLPYMKKIEKLFIPRWSFFSSRLMESVVGIFVFCLTLLLMLPIPFSNFFIAALIMIFGLGMSERDGLAIVIGFVGTIIYIAFIYLLIWAALEPFFH